MCYHTQLKCIMVNAFIQLYILNNALCSCSKGSSSPFLLLKPAFYSHASNHLTLPISQSLENTSDWG